MEKVICSYVATRLPRLAPKMRGRVALMLRGMWWASSAAALSTALALRRVVRMSVLCENPDGVRIDGSPIGTGSENEGDCWDHKGCGEGVLPRESPHGTKGGMVADRERRRLAGLCGLGDSEDVGRMLVSSTGTGDLATAARG